MSSDGKRITFVVSEILANRLEMLLEREGFLNRSEFIRNLLRDEIERQEIVTADRKTIRSAEDSK